VIPSALKASHALAIRPAVFVSALAWAVTWDVKVNLDMMYSLSVDPNGTSPLGDYNMTS